MNITGARGARALVIFKFCLVNLDTYFFFLRCHLLRRPQWDSGFYPPPFLPAPDPLVKARVYSTDAFCALHFAVVFSKLPSSLPFSPSRITRIIYYSL